jgi:hypothetical protein
MNKAICRENYPGYMGHIPLKNDVNVGMSIGATNEMIKQIVSSEPQKEDVLIPRPYADYSYYNKDYFNHTFSKDYPLEEDKIFSNRSSLADTWVGSSKYQIYPQHIPGYKSHVPGIYSSNIHGMGYSKSTAIAIKGEYPKGQDLTSDDRFRSTTNHYYGKPKNRSEGKYMI